MEITGGIVERHVEIACSNAAQSKKQAFPAVGSTERQWGERIFHSVQF
jgi:hypothetical protein